MVIRQRRGIRGLIVLELDRFSTAKEAEAIVDVVAVQADRLEGNLVVIEPGRTRIRPLRRQER